MDLRKLSVETWKELNESGNPVRGYKSAWLALKDNEESDLHIFKDELGQFHLSIKTSESVKNIIEDPGVNGLQIGLDKYKFENGEINLFIDLKCNLPNFLEEFTEVVKEISTDILVNNNQPLYAVNQVISNWISFWANQKKLILSDEAQIGLICELLILRSLCRIHPKNALSSWTGPLGEQNDFSFTEWNLEVKGTRKSSHIHTINGLDQLNPPSDKHLGFISFLVSESTNDNAISLPFIINSIAKDFFADKSYLLIHFNELLAGTGYSPVHAKDYINFKIEIQNASLFEVDRDFPKLISSMLNGPLSSRVSSVRYAISLEGMSGLAMNDLNWGNYFY